MCTTAANAPKEVVSSHFTVQPGRRKNEIQCPDHPSHKTLRTCGGQELLSSESTLEI